MHDAGENANVCDFLKREVRLFWADVVVSRWRVKVEGSIFQGRSKCGVKLRYCLGIGMRCVGSNVCSDRTGVRGLG